MSVCLFVCLYVRLFVCLSKILSHMYTPFCLGIVLVTTWSQNLILCPLHLKCFSLVRFSLFSRDNFGPKGPYSS